MTSVSVDILNKSVIEVLILDIAGKLDEQEMPAILWLRFKLGEINKRLELEVEGI